MMAYKISKKKVPPDGWLFVVWKDANGKLWKAIIPASAFPTFQLNVMRKGGVMMSSSGQSKKENTYTVFAGSSYWKSYSNKAKAQKEAARLRKDGGKRIRVTKQ